MKLSIVSTLFHSAPYIQEFCTRVAAASRKLVGEDYEIVLVNDGSPDNSLEIAISLTCNDRRIVVVDLTKNFGHHNAIMAGLETATAEKVFLIDIDLEEDPELLLEFWEQMQQTKVDLINGRQISRKGGGVERVSGHLYYLVYNALSNVKIEPNLMMAKLMTKRFKNALIAHKERAFFLGGILASVGFEVGYYDYVKKHKGTTTYSFTRKVTQALNSIVSFSNKPLYYLVVLGSFISAIALLAIVYFVIRKLTSEAMPDGWTSLIIVILGMSGLIISAVGLLGVYIAKLFEEVKARPNYIVRDVYRGSK
jgi:putative glycosyltransferase